MGEEKFSVVGKRWPRVDGVMKVTGRATYVADIKAPRMLYGATLKSPYPHAKILSIDTGEAKKLPGVVTVITGKDIRNNRNVIGQTVADKSVLQDDKVRFIGDEVVAVAAVSEEIALKALELIDVKYEILPAVFDPEEAMKSGAPVLHDEYKNNIVLSYDWSSGDPELGFREADHVFENKFKTQLVDHAPIEMEGAVVSYEPRGVLTVWSPSQGAFRERATLSRALGIPENRVRVITPTIGGAFGGKDYSTNTFICAALAVAVGDGSPVKMIRSREDEFICTTMRHPMTIYLKTGVKKNGVITARECKVIVENGAYTDYGQCVAISFWDLFSGVYKCPNLRCEAYVVYTNHPYGGAMRGFGNPQVTFARESQMDIIAKKLGVDPLELRLINAIETGHVKGSGWKIRSCGLKECLRKAAEAIGWDEKRKSKGEGRKVRGVGIACGEHWSGYRSPYNSSVWRTGYAKPDDLYKVNPSSPYIVIHPDGTAHWRPWFELGPYDSDSSSCILVVNEDGTVTLHAGDVDRGQGLYTTLAIVAAEELGVKLEDVKVKLHVDTDAGAYSPGTYGSRATYISGKAVWNAAREAKKILFNFASSMLEADPETLEAKDGKIFVKDAPERFVWVADAAYRAYATRDGGHIITKGYFDADSALFDMKTGKGSVSAPWIFFAQAVEVEVDTETGEVKVLNVASAHDAGKLINPIGAEGQVEGSVAMGLGYVLTEEIYLDGGRVLNPNLLRYVIPSAVDMPKITKIFVETREPYGPFGAKGLGEPAAVPVAPAVANAIDHAVDVRVTELPITPEKVLKSLMEKQ